MVKRITKLNSKDKTVYLTQLPALKKTERRISWNIYLIALIISIIIFGVGIMVGLQIEKSVSESLMTDITNTRQSMTSVETMMLSEDSPEFCSFFMEEMNNFDNETASLGQQIGYMEEHRGEDATLKSEYMTLELRDYLLVKRIDKLCDTKTNTILYFLDSVMCSDCLSQGSELTKARQNASIRVYSFDMTVNNTAINVLKNSFNVSNYPSLVINGKLYAGSLNSEEIDQIVNK